MEKKRVVSFLSILYVYYMMDTLAISVKRKKKKFIPIANIYYSRCRDL